MVSAGTWGLAPRGVGWTLPGTGPGNTLLTQRGYTRIEARFLQHLFKCVFTVRNALVPARHSSLKSFLFFPLFSEPKIQN